MHYYLNHSNQTKGYATSAMRKIRKKIVKDCVLFEPEKALQQIKGLIYKTKFLVKKKIKKSESLIYDGINT